MEQEPGGEQEPELEACVVRFASARSDVTARVLWVNGDTEVEYARLHAGVSGGRVQRPAAAAAACRCLPPPRFEFARSFAPGLRPLATQPYRKLLSLFTILTAVLVQPAHVHYTPLAASRCRQRRPAGRIRGRHRHCDAAAGRRHAMRGGTAPPAASRHSGPSVGQLAAAWRGGRLHPRLGLRLCVPRGGVRRRACGGGAQGRGRRFAQLRLRSAHVGAKPSQVCRVLPCETQVHAFACLAWMFGLPHAAHPFLPRFGHLPRPRRACCVMPTQR